MNKKLKTSVSVLLTAAVLACSIACSSAPETGKVSAENPVTIQLWHYYNGTQNVAFEKLVSEFNETESFKSGITVEARSQGSVGELISKVVAAGEKKVGAEKLPDVFSAYVDTAYQMDKLGLVASLEGYFTKAELAEYIPGYIEEGKFGADGTLKILPIAKSTEVMMLNKTDWDKFSAETGADVKTLETMEGLVEVAGQYYKWTDSKTPESGDGKAFFGRDAMANYFIVGMKQMGVDLFSVTNGDVKLNLNEAELRRMWDCFYIPYVKGWFANYSRFSSDDAKTGGVIALVASTSGAAYFPREVVVTDTESYPIEALVMEPPSFSGGESVAVQQGAGMVITKSSPEREYAASEFLKWFTDGERNLKFAIDSGYIPVKTAVSSVSMLDKTIESSGEDISELLERSLEISLGITEKCDMYTSAAFDGGAQARDILDKSLLEKAKNDRKTVLEAIAAGAAPEEALSKFLTDENFSEWYAAFSKGLKTACGLSV